MIYLRRSAWSLRKRSFNGLSWGFGLGTSARVKPRGKPARRSFSVWISATWTVDVSGTCETLCGSANAWTLYNTPTAGPNTRPKLLGPTTQQSYSYQGSNSNSFHRVASTTSAPNQIAYAYALLLWLTVAPK